MKKFLLITLVTLFTFGSFAESNLDKVNTVYTDIPVKIMFKKDSTLNVMLPSVLTWALLFGEFAFHVLNTSKYAVKKAKAKKFIWAVYAAMFALGVVMTAVCLYLASYAMMHRV